MVDGDHRRRPPDAVPAHHLDELGVLTLDRLHTAEPGSRVKVAGVVTHRQRPMTAQGITFLNLEDETGLVNIVVSKGCWARFRRVAQEAPAMLIRGRLERSEGVVNVVAEHLERLALPGASVHPVATSTERCARRLARWRFRMVVEEWRRECGRAGRAADGLGLRIDRGPADATTVLVLHGFPGSTFDWRHVIDDLAADHRVVGHDFVGFGLSSKPSTATTRCSPRPTAPSGSSQSSGSPGRDRRPRHRRHRGRRVAPPSPRRRAVVRRGRLRADERVDLHRPGRTVGRAAGAARPPDEPLVESLGSELLGAGLAATFPPSFTDGSSSRRSSPSSSTIGATCCCRA